ncbi:unnamed protein product [Rhizophagus irregularis]|nr:unnamed protein product [Rhizophagus irregularis]
MEEKSSENTQPSEFTHDTYSLDDCSNIGNEMVLSMRITIHYCIREGSLNYGKLVKILLTKEVIKDDHWVLKGSSHPLRLLNLSQETNEIAENVGRLATIKKIARNKKFNIRM